MDIEPFLYYVLERHRIYLRRAAGQPRPWTTDPILREFSFTNDYRELDRTTVWFRQYVREPLRARPEVLLATVLFRWINRTSTCESVFRQPGLLTNETAFETMLRTGDPVPVRDTILAACTRPYVTGAFIIKTPDGMEKLSGVLWCVGQFMRRSAMVPHVQHTLDWEEAAASMLGDEPWTARAAQNWLVQFPYLGSFMAAQIVADLKYTALLDRAADWHTFASSGPGSRKGLNIILGRPPETPWREYEWHQRLLEVREAILPSFAAEGWEPPHAQDTQNMFCEYSKFVRGFSRNRYRDRPNI